MQTGPIDDGVVGGWTGSAGFRGLFREIRMEVEQLGRPIMSTATTFKLVKPDPSDVDRVPLDRRKSVRRAI